MNQRIPPVLIDKPLTEWQAAYIESAYRELESGVMRERIAELELDVQGKALLDVGCGPGNFLVGVSVDRPKLMVGVDLDAQFLAFAHAELARRLVTNVTLMKGTAPHLPFIDECFDVVTCFLVLPHVPDDRKALTELARVLRKGGTLAISGHGSGFPLRYLSRLRFKPLAMYLWSLIYALTGKKLVRNTLQNDTKISRALTDIGFVIDAIMRSRKRLGFVETYRIKAIKTG